MLFVLTSESLEELLEGIWGRPVILLLAVLAGNCFIRVGSSGGESCVSSGSAIETTERN
jgi:hypothetical protein